MRSNQIGFRASKQVMNQVVRWLLVLAVAGLLVGNAVACPVWMSSVDATAAKGCCQQSSKSEHCPATVCQVEAPYLVSTATAHTAPLVKELPGATPRSALISARPVVTLTMLLGERIAQHASEPLFLQIHVLLI